MTAVFFLRCGFWLQTSPALVFLLGKTFPDMPVFPLCPGYFLLRFLMSSWDSCGISFSLLGDESSLSGNLSSSFSPALSFPASPLVMGCSDRCSSAPQTQWCCLEGAEEKRRVRNPPGFVMGLVHGLGVSPRWLCWHNDLFWAIK